MVKPSSFTYHMENHQNHNPNPDPDLEKQYQQHQHQVWGTWEELLLACAVNRHGFKDWDAVAMEVQSRTTLPHLFATARHCEQKFHDLNRRFADQCNDDAPPPCQNGVAARDSSDHVPWLDELRKLRVAELRREVQSYDVSILSLQLKVKRLEEEREKENDRKEDEKPDLAVSGKQRLPENDKTGGKREETEPASSEPEIRRLDESTTNTDKLLPTTGDESDRENQSVNESNSTGSRFEGGKTGEGDVKLGHGQPPVQAGPSEPDPAGRKGKSVGEESNNGSCDTAAKVPTCESVPPSEERKAEEDDSSELGDSVARSGEGGTREGSEVQSSASLTRKRKTRRRKDVSGGDGGCEVEPGNDEAAVVKSEPLVSVLELIKGHEHSSLFERRLDSQESDRYKNIVRQHVDLETIQLRLHKGYYSSCTSAFFRDLLLLFTNATVFFPKDSAESRAAQQLRFLVTAEMKNRGQAQSDPSPQKTDSLPPNAPLAKPDSLFSKHKASAPILVCRKHRSISAKPSSATFGQKGDQPIINDKKERPSSDAKPTLKPSSSETDEEEPSKAKEKPVTGVRSLRRSNKNLNSNPGNNKKLPSNSTPKAGSSANKPAETTPKLEKSKADGVPDKKRNAAADFLKRIKRNAPVEALRSGSGGGGGSSSSSRGGGGGVSSKEQKKMVNSGKGDKGKERASRHNGGGGSGSGDKRNKNIENSSQSKRSVGRPPKKAAETNAVSAKRGRESSASAGKDKRPKKRSKK